MFRGAYGVLNLMPWEFGRLTPGEYSDLMTARAWVNRQRNDGPLIGPARDMELAKFDAQRARSRG